MLAPLCIYPMYIHPSHARHYGACVRILALPPEEPLDDEEDATAKSDEEADATPAPAAVATLANATPPSGHE